MAPSNIQQAQALLTPKPKKVVPPLPTIPNIWEGPIKSPTITKKVTPTVTPKSTTTTKPKTVVPKKDTVINGDIIKDDPIKDDPIITVDEPLLDEILTDEPVAGGYSAQEPQFDVNAYINALAQAKADKAIADLGRARDMQLSNLSGEEAGIKPMYYDKRNSATAGNMMARRTLAEELASRGETRSGVADQANINANMSLQGQTGLLNRQEASDISDIARRRTGVQNAYESDVTSARAGFDAAAMENLIDQFNADRQFKLQEGGLTGSYNGGQTLQAQGQTFNQDMQTKQLEDTRKQQNIDNLYRQDVFDYGKSRDVVSDTHWQQSMNLDLRQQTFQETQANVQNAMSQNRISQEDAAQALQWAKFNAEQDPNSLDNQLKKQQLNSTSSNKNTTSTVDDYASTINSLYITNDGYRNSVDKAGLQAYLDRLIMSGVDDAIIDSLASRYGL